MNKRHGIGRRIGIVLLLGLVTISPVLQGCASSGGKTYSRGEVRTAQDIYYGTVVDIREVTVEEDPSLLGPVIGGVAGGVVGSVFGGGTGKILATVGGALAGAALGATTEYGLRRYTASELTVELEDGRALVVVQGNDEYFLKGDRVRMLDMGDGTVRVQHR